MAGAAEAGLKIVWPAGRSVSVDQAAAPTHLVIPTDALLNCVR
jgi:hypothetical protein